jgi:uncharacterized protein
MLYIGFAEDQPGTSEKRESLRQAHHAYLHKTPEVVVLGGPLLDGSDGRLGSCIMIDAPDMAAAEAWYANEPFNKNGCFKSLRIARVRQGIWNPNLVASPA